MRTFLVFLAVLAVVTGAGAIVYFKLFDFHLTPYVGVCKEDDEIDAPDRSAINDAATAFLQRIQTDAPATVIASMSDAGKQFTTEEQLQQFVAQMRAQDGMSPLAPIRDFYLTSTGGQSSMMPCETAFVAAGSTSRTAHILLERHSRGSAIAYSVFMEFERGAWRVRGIWQGSATFGGHDGEELARMARGQRQSRHLFNATILYGSARTALQRGSWVQLKSWQDVDADAHTFTLPAEFSGDAPWTWTSGAARYTVTGVNYVGVADGHVVLDVHQRLPQWNGEADAEAANKRLIDFINATYPEWKEIADTLAVRSEEPQGGLFGTVYSRDSGYAKPAPTAAQN